MQVAPLLSKAAYLVSPLPLIRRELSRYPALFKVVDGQYSSWLKAKVPTKLFTPWFCGCPHLFT
jgi:hypothetical protein